MTSIFCDPDHFTLAKAKADRKIALYNTYDHNKKICCAGNNVRDALARVDLTIPVAAFDFLTIALSVIAADEFVTRKDAAYGFSREIDLEISLAKPRLWNSLKSDIQSILTFLTGDDWQLKFSGNGLTPPVKSENKRLRSIQDVKDIDRVCLFSGGLDSLVGAINELDGFPDCTLLVSRASPKDRQYQEYLRKKLGHPKHFGVNDAPTRPSSLEWEKEESTRARSILFLALAACLASGISKTQSGVSVPLIIPENGFIALNPPLTPRRRGSLSTRTAHPHFLSAIQEIFDKADFGVHIHNPFAFDTKGEIITQCNDQTLIDKLFRHSVSCGKWKRRNQQCGKCVPCLIRRSAIYAAGKSEPKHTYETRDLSKLPFSSKTSADLAAMITACKTVTKENLGKWVSASGPLPLQPKLRKQHYDVAWRGLSEIHGFLIHSGIQI